MTAPRPADQAARRPAGPGTAPESPSERAARAVERMLRPLVRLLVGRVACIYVIDRLRRLYLEEARAWLERTQPDQRVTRSKLAMLTGLDTRTISAMEHDPDHESLLAHEVCAGSVVLDRWIHHEGFQDADGQPALLPVMGPGSSFQALTARAVGRNITVHTMLDQLVESGNVRIESGERVRLVDPVYRPVRPSELTVLDAGSHSIARLTETVVHNLDAEPGQGRLQQDRLSRMIPEDRYPELELRARELIEQHIAALDSLVGEYECHDLDGAAAPSGVRSLGVGWYVFE
ncbi:hypothetical protein HFP89_06615 [Wenzhouxiangella sp. XN79A]|uniref:DUF6502 family protein n=1 Tax=Wenzhouxiangella sp. XN79A TaxID=2724193 RepID=UPI00144AF085|nr:DUF6502 family protein [Wenzhouxiangella sp. XN79A]NKI34834.1 hypothetical protein [Wenzhouxiangella sp. XN79A]